MREIETRRGKWEFCWRGDEGILSYEDAYESFEVEDLADLKDLAELCNEVHGWVSYVRSSIEDVSALHDQIEEVRKQLALARAGSPNERMAALESWAESELKRQRDLAVADADAMQEKLMEALRENAELKARVEQ